MVIAKCAALLFVGLVLALFALTMWYSRVPSDNQVQQRFARDKEAIIELLNKLSREPASIVGVTKDKVMLDDTGHWVSPQEAGFSSEHFTEYEALMHKAHVLQLWRAEGEMEFAIAGWGWASNGWRLSFAHLDAAPPSQVSSIDHPPMTGQEGSVIYRPLGDGWYIRLIY
jgi:hypothetical protein